MKFKSLRVKLMALLVGVVVFSNVLLVFIAYFVSKSALEKSVEGELSSIAENVASAVRLRNEREFHMLDILANTTFVQDPDVPTIEKCSIVQHAKSTDSNYENITFYDKDGMTVTGDGEFVDCSNREYFIKAMGGEKFVSNPSFSPVNGKLLIFYSVPVRSLHSSDIIGVVAAVFYGDTLSKLCQEIMVGDESHPFILDMKTGATVADSNVKYVQEAQNIRDSTTGAMHEAILDAMAGSVSYRSFFEPRRNKHMVASYRPVGDNCSWAVFCMAPYDEFFGSISRMAFLMAVVVILILVISSGLCAVVTTLSLNPLKEVVSSITDIASGNADLTKRIKVKSDDEIGHVVAGFNKFTEKLQSIISSVKESNRNLTSVDEDMSASVEDTASSITQIIANIDSMRSQIESQNGSVNQTAGAVNEIAANIESLERMIESQSGGVSEASAAVEEMIGNISSVNNSMDKMAKSFGELRSDAQIGIDKQRSVNERVEQIENQSQMLQEANGAISAIAEQTNLLAMNAAIEAAHAGEAGKGFAVVADEIRKLSETSTVQSKTIGDQLLSIKNSIVAVVSASAEASSAFESVSKKLEETDMLVMQIKSAMEEQNEGSRQITTALHNMNDSTVAVKRASSEMSAGNQMILKEIQHLQNVAMSMSDGMSEMSVGARKINETGAALNGMSDKMSESVGEIGKQIDQFTV